MERALQRWRRFWRGEDGPTAVEYAVILALIVLICITTIRRLGRNSRRPFNNAARSLRSAS